MGGFAPGRLIVESGANKNWFRFVDGVCRFLTRVRVRYDISEIDTSTRGRRVKDSNSTADFSSISAFKKQQRPPKQEVWRIKFREQCLRRA